MDSLIGFTKSVMVLTGGRSSRFGSDKSLARIGDKSSLEWIVGAVPQEMPIIIVGPEPTLPLEHPAGVHVLREEPEGGGPVAGLWAGLQGCASEHIFLVATDMPFVLPYLLQIEIKNLENTDAFLYRDPEGFLQPLAGVYNTAALARRFSEIGDPYGQSMRQFVSGLKVHELTMSKELAESFLDIDTVEQLSTAITYAKLTYANTYGSKYD
jgi:molybdopterin-guanine dinucleotide biosynthesis protein A